MSVNPEAFDDVLMSMAKQHKGVADLLDTVFNFLRRRTDFYTGVPLCTAKRVILEKFSLYEPDLREAEKKKKSGEASRKYKAGSEDESFQENEHADEKPWTFEIAESKIEELTEGEAEEFQKELDMKSQEETSSTKVSNNKCKDDEEEETGLLKLESMTGWHLPMYYRCWTESEIEGFRNEHGSALSPNASIDESLDIKKNPLLLTPHDVGNQNQDHDFSLHTVISCLFRFLNIKEVKNCRFVCREWGSIGILALARRVRIQFGKYDVRAPEALLRLPVDFTSCFQDSAKFFTAFKFSGSSSEEECNPWTAEELGKFFEEQQKWIKELKFISHYSTVEFVRNMDLRSWLSKSPLVKMDTEHMTKLSIDISGSDCLLEIPLSLIAHIKDLSLSLCRINLEAGIQISPINLKFQYIFFYQGGIKLNHVRVNDIVDFRNSKNVSLRCIDLKECVLDLKGNITLDNLLLENVEVVNGESSQWVIEQLEMKGIPYSLNSQMQIKELCFSFAAGTIDLFTVSNSIQKLSFKDIGGLSCSQPIALKNLQYFSFKDSSPTFIQLTDRNYSFLAHFMNCPQLIFLKLSGDTNLEMKSIWIPRSVKTLRLEKISINWTDDPEESCLHLEKLVVDDFTVAKKLCETNIRVDHLIVSVFYMPVSTSEDLVDFLKCRKYFNIAGKLYFGTLSCIWSKKDFSESGLKEYVDIEASCYVFENEEKGRPLSISIFRQLIPKQ